jgi:hypothetical protein
MRRYWREQQPPGMFRGGDLMRLMAAIFMLVLICMLMVRFRDPNMWGWAAKDDGKPAETADRAAPPPAHKPAASPGAVSARPLPAATGPTDEDPDQAEEVRNEFQAMTDGALTLGPEEMEAYDRLVFWVKNQSFERLRRRARKDLLFTNFHDEPDKCRGQLAALDMTVRRIVDAGKNRDGVPLHEVWGFTKESGNRLYVAIVVDLPKGMPVGPDVYEKARFAGYFLKLQGYHAAGARPGAAPEKAPVLIGRLEWEPTPVAAPPFDTRQEWFWGLGILAAIGLVVGLRWVYRKLVRRKSAARSAMIATAGAEQIPIEAWLERSSLGETDQSDQGHEEGDSRDGGDRPDDHSGRGTPSFPDGLDGG